jgi:hypothetical protein
MSTEFVHSWRRMLYPLLEKFGVDMPMESRRSTAVMVSAVASGDTGMENIPFSGPSHSARRSRSHFTGFSIIIRVIVIGRNGRICPCVKESHKTWLQCTRYSTAMVERMGMVRGTNGRRICLCQEIKERRQMKNWGVADKRVKSTHEEGRIIDAGGKVTQKSSAKSAF